MLVFLALDNAKVLSFGLGDAKVPNASSFAFWWNIGPGRLELLNGRGGGASHEVLSLQIKIRGGRDRFERSGGGGGGGEQKRSELVLAWRT